MEHDLVAFRCTSCEYEFAVVILNKPQITKNDANPFCPDCGDQDDVTPIDCVILKMFDRGIEFSLQKAVKPLPE